MKSPEPLKKLALLVIGIILTVMTYLHYSDDPKPRVITLPGNYDPFAVYPGYTGPHPSLLRRPEETFPFPIKLGQAGPVEPLFAGPLHYPYLCRTEDAELGQPLVDNHEGAGIRVYAETDTGRKTRHIIGYSKDCSLPSRAWYIYKRKNSDDFLPLENAQQDIDTLQVNGKTLPFILRVEVGTINRHPYLLLVPRGVDETLDTPNGAHWNRKLIYQFRGGVGIGKRQGRLNIDTILKRRQQQLAQGYAVIHSTANQTSNHYNLWLAEDTALRVKRQFTSLYGIPLYTVGIGGSGGGLQQYVLGQNNPDIIDAAIAQYSYPDMVTQTNYVLDCELLEYYFDVTARDNPRWSDWSNRRAIEGLNALDTGFNKYTWIQLAADIFSLRKPRLNLGSSECADAWRGLTPLILNPRYPQLPDAMSRHVQSLSRLTYWDDLKYFYGTDDRGYARISWGNRGVQYGLEALTLGKITTQEFLHLNHHIGSWKKPRDMRQEYFWFLGRDPDSSAERFSVWSQHNMQLSPDGGKRPAPRAVADEKAIAAAYRSGQVFIGHINIPIIDLRHYMEDELDMHHSIASFQARARIIDHRGHADNQVIWMTRKPHLPNQQAFDVIDEWMENIRNQPDRSPAENRPATAVDTCFRNDGSIIARGEQVWDGPWNNRPSGECLEAYPPFSTSRLVAGESIRGDSFSCRLQSVQQAIDRGLYQPVDMQPYLSRLQAIFPDGVCDYSKPEPARPPHLDSILTKKNGSQGMGPEKLTYEKTRLGQSFQP